MFKYKDCRYYKDMRNFKINRKTDYFTCSSQTVYVDQMINYAAIRKSQSELDSYKLDFVGEMEVGAGKLDYSKWGTIKTIPYTNYWIFVKYNIRDTLVQKKVEDKVSDIELMYGKAYDSSTRFSKTYKETVFLRNKAFMEFRDQGYILGNNHNITYGDYDHEEDENQEKFEGALVGDPKLNDPTGMKIFGDKRSNHVFNNVQDYDYSALYPSIIDIFNIFATTQIGRVLMNNKKPTDREIKLDDRYDRGGKLLDDLELREPILFGYRWLNLPKAEDVIDDFEKYLGSRAIKKVHVKKMEEQCNNDIRKVLVRRVE